METENQQSSLDEVGSALRRANAKLDGSLASEVRREIWHIAHADMTSDRDKKLDAFIEQQRGNERFKDCFNTPAREKERPLRHDLLRLTPEEFEAIAAGKVKVE